MDDQWQTILKIIFFYCDHGAVHYAQIGGIFVWALVIVALVLAGFVAVTWIRRWASSADDAPAGGFTLGELRRLHQAGQMTDEEYEKAKAMIVEAAKAVAARKQADQQPGGKKKR